MTKDTECKSQEEGLILKYNFALLLQYLLISAGARMELGCQVPVVTKHCPGPLHVGSQQKNLDLNISLFFFFLAAGNDHGL